MEGTRNLSATRSSFKLPRSGLVQQEYLGRHFGQRLKSSVDQNAPNTQHTAKGQALGEKMRQLS